MKSINEYLLTKNNMKMSKETNGLPKLQKADVRVYDVLEIVDFLKVQEFEEIPYDKDSTFNNMLNILMMNEIKKDGNFDKNYFMYDRGLVNSWVMFCSGKWAESVKITDHHLYQIYFKEVPNKIIFKIDSDNVELDKFKEEVDKYFYW